MPPFTVHRLGDYLGGRFLSSSLAEGWIEDRNPADLRQVVGRFPWHPDHVDRAVEWARLAQPDWARMSLAERTELVQKFLDCVRTRPEFWAQGISTETGRPAWESDLEVRAALRAAELVVEAAPRLLAAEDRPSLQGRFWRRPRGVVAVISPAPHPLFVPLSHLLPSLLAGNSVIWKPSSTWPGLAQELVDCFDGIGFPRGVLGMLQGPGDFIGRDLVAHSGVDAVVLGSSARTARLVARELPGSRPHLFGIRGAKAQAIVTAEADLDLAAHEVAVGAFLSAGQRVNATGRVFVERSVLPAFLERLLAMTGGMRVGPEADAFCGPMIKKVRLQHFLGWVKRVRDRDEVELLFGGGRHPSATPGQFVKPAIFLDSGPNLLEVEEVPGPVLVVVPVDSFEEALQRHERSPFALASAIFTRRETHFLEARHRLAAGILNWNRSTVVASFQFPVSGQRASGSGHAGNLDIFHFVTHGQASLAGPRDFPQDQVLPGIDWPGAEALIDGSIA